MAHNDRHDRIEAAEVRLHAVVLRAMRKAFKRYGFTAAGDPQDPTSYAELLVLWERAADAEVFPHLADLFLASASDELVALIPDVDPAFGDDFSDNIRRTYVDQYLSVVRNRVVGIGNSTFKDIVRGIQAGIAEGETPDELADRVRHAMDTTATRAKLIARTEAAAAVNAGDYAVHRELSRTGFEVKRRWLAARDSRTRKSHVAANGQVVGVSEPFVVGGARLKFPGDPEGPAKETIACRCTTQTELA